MRLRPWVTVSCKVSKNALIVKRLSKLPQWLRLLARYIFLTNHARGQAILVTSMDLADHPTLRVALGYSPVFHSRLLPSRAALYLGWGRKWSGRRAVAIAEAKGAEFRLLEDGFLCSVKREEFGLSLIFDHKGIYYDATVPSALEVLIAAPLSTSEKARTQTMMAAWRDNRLSKYNAARDHEGQIPAGYVLVVDQAAGDLSIGFGLAGPVAFKRMLEAALAENPDKTIVIKLHPDALMHAGRRHFDPDALAAVPRVRVISENCHVARLIENADTVYTVTSQVGFEALIWGKRVRCFGMPFYAGWGLTEDALQAPDRRKATSLEQLVYAAFVKYPRYIDPLSSKLCQPERVFAHVGLQRRRRSEFPPTIAAIGFSRWKRPFVAKFVQGSEVAFEKKFKKRSPGHEPEAIAVWGGTEVSAPWKGKQVLRLEDGFLRSSGLGADLVRPLSLVIDDVGIYFDATRSSRLEIILGTQELGSIEMNRARALRERIIQLDLTKYNLDRRSWVRPDTDQQVLLIVGQVETDASIRLGSPEVRSNIDLLRRVRAERPDAYLVYKPHPDVIAGLRCEGVLEGQARDLADEVLTAPVSVGQLLGQIDELHTMTSLMGFEALMRGRKVVCHGLPFYAGWGLTEDRLSCDRRQRKLSLDELVYGALIAYPRYFNYEANCFVEPEDAIEQLAVLAEHGPKTRSWSRKFLRASILTWLKLTGSRR